MMKTKRLILLLAIGLIFFFTNGAFADEVVSKEQVSKSAKETVSKNTPSKDTEDASQDKSSVSKEIEEQLDNQEHQDPEDPETLIRTTTGSEPFSSSEKFQVEPSTGTATLTIPIEVPQGRKGIQPSISLMYNSSSPNSILGVGWSLELGSIQRSTKRGVPEYDNTDTFVLVQQGSTQELVSTTGNEYRAKIEGAFMRLEYLGSSGWTVTDKKGIKYYFGQTQDSQQYDPNNTSHIFKWCLDKVQDLNDNYMTIIYTKDQNQIYPDQITYVGAKVSFIQEESRPDNTMSYRTGFKITTAKRLKEIKVEVMVNWQYQLIRKYLFDYSQSTSTQRSLIASITQYGADGTSSLPPTNFSYQTLTSNWEFTTGWNIPEEVRFGHWRPNRNIFVDEGVRLADVNADGFTDIIRYKTPSERGVYFNNKTDGWYIDNAWAIPDTMQFVGDRDCYIADHGIRLVDVDADGYVDLVKHYASYGGTENVIYLNNKTNGWDLSSLTMPSDTHFLFDHSTGGPCQGWQQNMGVLLSDVNADGYIDIVKSGDYERCYLNDNGNGWYESPEWQPPQEIDFSDGSHTLVDVNGDGLPDIVKAKNGDRKTYINNGTGWIYDSSWDMPDGEFDRNHTQLVDINGDGLADIVIAQTNTHTVYINNGHGWYLDNSWSLSLANNNIDLTDTRTRFLDATGDGLLDLMRHYNFEGGQLYINDGASSNDFTDLLETVDNGIGGTTVVSYMPSTQYDNTGDDDKCDLPFPIQTVSQTTATDQVSGQSYTTNYEYAGGLWDWQSREFRGFGYAKVIDVEGNYSETDFLQGDYNKGRIARQATYDSSGNLYTKVINDWQEQDLGNSSKFVYLNKTDNYIYNGDSSGKRTQAQNSYDNYGDITQAVTLGEVDIDDGTDLDPADNRKSQIEYTYNTTDWLISLPKTTYLTNHNGQILKQSWFYYDGNQSPDDPPTQGLLTKQEGWLLGSNQNPVTSYQYDDYGNLLSTTDALDHITTITYDTGYQIFPLVTANHLEHQVVNEYYGINGVPLDDGTYRGLWGQLKSSTDPNGNTSFSIYDTFGRIEKTVSPYDSIEYPTSSIEYHLESVPIKIISHQRQISGSPDTLDTLSFYDGLGRLIQTKTESEEANKFVVSGQTEYNSRGLPFKKYLPFFDTNYSFSNCVPISQNPYSYATISYDALGRVTQSTNPDGTYSTIEYDDWATTTIDENGHKQKSYFNAFGRLIQREEYTGDSPDAYTLYATTAYTYDLLGNLIQTQDQANNIVTISYDTLSRKTSMSDPDMGEWSYEYNKVGNLIKQTDAKGQEITFEYDELNRLITKTSSTDPDNPHQHNHTRRTISTVSYTYDDPDISHSKGRLTQASYSQAQGDTRFYYDALGREISSEKTIDNITYTVERSYDSAGRLTSVTYPDSEVVNYSYNSAGQIEQIKTITNADPYTKLLLHCDGGDGSTNFPDSSVFNHPVTAHGDAQIDAAEYKFGSASGLFDGDSDYLDTADSSDWDIMADLSQSSTVDLWVRHTDHEGVETYVANCSDAGQNDSWFLYHYHGLGLGFYFNHDGTGPYGLINGVGEITDSNWHHIALVIIGDGSEFNIKIYKDGNEVGSSTTTETANFSNPLRIGKRSQQSYYFNGHIDELRISKGIARWTSNFTPPANSYSSDVEYFVSNVDYNASGQITRIEYGNGTVTEYEYDENTLRLAHLVTEHQGSSIQDLSYTYDSVGNIIEIVDGVNTASQDFSYDELNRLMTANNSVYGNKTYAYDEVGNMILKDGVNYYYGEGDAGPHAITSGSDGSEFFYDDNGNMTSWLTADEDTFNYEFDAENRLKQVKKNNSLLAKFEYDGDGGRTKKIIYISAVPNYTSLEPDKSKKRYVFEFLSSLLALKDTRITTDMPNEAVQESYASVSRRIAKEVSAFGDNNGLPQIEAEHDIRENPNLKSAAISAWNDFISVREAEAASFRDPAHNQSVYAGSTQTTTYIGSLYEKTNGVPTKHIFLGSQRIASIKNQGSSIQYYHTNHLGSTDTITNELGQEIVHYEYAPYGEIVLTDGPDSTDYKFTGKPLDDETGLYFYGARYYNPVIGRFITPDPTIQRPSDPQDLNRYTYCRNNPVNLIDPTGLGWWSKFWEKVSGFFGAVIGTIVGIVTANPLLGIATYSAISASGQSGNFGRNFGISLVSGVVGWGIGAGIASLDWGFAGGLFASALGGAGAGATTSAMLGGDVGLGALAGLAGGTIGYVGGYAWPLGAEAVAGGVSAEIMGGDFGEGALQGGLHSMGKTVGGILAPMQTLGEQDVQAGDTVYFKPDSAIGWGMVLFEGGIFSHTGIALGDAEMAHSTMKTGADIVDFKKSPEYLSRKAYILKRFRGNRAIIRTAKALAIHKTGYGFLPGQNVCSTFNAAAFNRAGYRGWHGIGPNSQARYRQFYITRTYGY